MAYSVLQLGVIVGAPIIRGGLYMWNLELSVPRIWDRAVRSEFGDPKPQILNPKPPKP